MNVKCRHVPPMLTLTEPDHFRVSRRSSGGGGDTIMSYFMSRDRHSRIRGGLSQSRCRHLVVMLVALGLLLGGPGGSQFVLAQAATQQTAESIRELQQELSELRSTVDRTAFDVQALADELAFEDAETIIAVVRDRIVFEQYGGVLRGPQGTLIAGAGNAVDQALLLTLLLNTVGYEARTALGELTPGQAEQLLSGLGRRPTPDTAGTGLTPQLTDLDEADLEHVLSQAEAERQLRLAESAEAASFISHELAEAGVELAGMERTELVEEARDYAWVEYRLSELDPWTAAHPAFSEPPGSLADIQASRYVDDVVPEELQHRFRFQVFIEQRLGDELEVRAITDPWEQATGMLYGVPFTWVNVPDGIEVGLSLAEALADTTFFHPVLNGSLAPGAHSFDRNGSSGESAFTATPPAGLFQTLGGLFGEAAGSLAGEEDPAEFVTLTAQWLEFTFISPGGEAVTHRRTVFDRIGADNRAAGIVELSGEVSREEAELALTRTHKFMVNPGGMNADYLFDSRLAALEQLLDYAAEAEAAAASTDAVPPVPQSAAEEAIARLEHLELFAAIDSFAEQEDVISYRHEPGLIVFESDQALDFARIDVVANPRRVFRLGPEGLPAAAPELAMEAGVWETRLEGLPLTSRGLATLSTFTTFSAAEAEGIEIRTLVPGEQAAVSELDLPAATRAAIAADLTAGYVVVSPVSVPADSPHAAWWRVHAETGETLGRGGDGRGAEMLEYQMQIDAALARIGLAISASTSLTACAYTSANAFQFSCCVWEATLITMGSTVLGLAVGGAFAGASIVMFVGLDVLGNVGLMAGSMADVIPSACSALGGAATCMLPLL